MQECWGEYEKPTKRTVRKLIPHDTAGPSRSRWSSAPQSAGMSRSSAGSSDRRPEGEEVAAGVAAAAAEAAAVAVAVAVAVPAGLTTFALEGRGVVRNSSGGSGSGQRTVGCRRLNVGNVCKGVGSSLRLGARQAGGTWAHRERRVVVLHLGVSSEGLASLLLGSLGVVAW